MKKILALLSFLALSFSFKSQTNLFKTNLIDWDTVRIKEHEINPKYANEDAVILFEKQHIYISSTNVCLTKYLRIKFNTKTGIEKYSSFFVPTSNDVFSDYYYTGLDKEKKINRPVYADYEVFLCQARKVISQKNYSVIDLEEKDIVEKLHNELIYAPKVGFTLAKEKSFIWQENKGYTKPVSYLFSFPDVKEGDTYDLCYKVNIPLITFLKNNSSRILFNGPIPKQKFELNVSYASDDLLLSFVNNNVAMLPDTIFGKNKSQTVTLIYKVSDLIGYENESNLRPYELPHVYFYINSRDYIKPSINGKVNVAAYDWSHVLYKSSYKLTQQSIFGVQGNSTLTFDYMKPYNRHYTAPYDEIFIPKEALTHYITFTDKHNLAITKLYNKTIDSIDINTDLSGAKRISLFHNYVLKNLQMYTSNERYNKDEFVNSVGELAEKGKLFENGRYKLYADFLYRTEKNFYRTRMIDKRYESLNNTIYYPPNTTVDFFSYLNNKSVETIFPKATNFGYFIDEYPFYFENNSAITTPYRITDTSTVILPPSFTKTHNSGFSTNIRNHTYTVTIDLEKNTCYFDGSITLSGQFSTLTRSIYTHNLIADSSINLNYYTKLVNEFKTAKNNKTTVVSIENKFPFKCKINQSFNFDELCEKTSNGYNLNLGKLSCHIIEKLKEKDRQTTYYSDFLMHDIFRYTFVFNKPIHINNTDELKKEPVVNSFGAYFNKISTPEPNKINFESNFKIIAEKTPNTSYKEVTDFYKKVSENKNMIIHFSQN